MVKFSFNCTLAQLMNVHAIFLFFLKSRTYNLKYLQPTHTP